MRQHSGALERKWNRQLTRPIFPAGAKNAVWKRDYLSPLCRYTTHSSVPHTATVEMPFLWHCSTNGKLRILVKAQPAPQAPGHCHQLGLAYGRETWLYPTNTLSATVAFLLLPDTNLLPQVAITHYSQLLTRQHSTKLLLVFFVCLFVFLFLFFLFFKSI